MNLRRRKYSEVKNQFVLAIVQDNIGALKVFMKKAPIWGAIFILFLIGKKYWDNGYITIESIQNELIGLAIFGGIMLIVFLVNTLIPHRAIVGIHPEGIWLWNHEIGDIGFLEWGWIKEIAISEKYQIVYLVVYDMDSIKRQIIQGIHKMGLETFVVASNGNEKALKVPLDNFSPEIFDYIDNNNLVPIHTIE